MNIFNNRLAQFTLLLTAALFFISCSSNSDPIAYSDSDYLSKINQEELYLPDVMGDSTLSIEETESILFMVEEEKVARDVYFSLYNDFGLRVFNNISRSEQKHMDAIVYLMERYALESPVVNEVGVFINPELQDLFDNLYAQGAASQIEALKVGALIEEVDIKDLDEAIENIIENNPDVTIVYSNLRKGSTNHLRAFVRNLQRQGVTYEPQVLDEATYNAIVN